MKKLFIEAIVVAIMTVIFGYIIDRLLSQYNNNSYLVRLAITGFAIHIFCEYTGINKWYCTGGNACIKN